MKEEFLKRKEALLADRKQHEMMTVLIDGALQDCDYWIKFLESKEEAPNSSLEE